MEPIFDILFYNAIQNRSQTSAGVLVPRIVRLLNPRSVVDVGCGAGLWLAEFLRCGVRDVLGIDGPWVPDSLLRIPPSSLLRHELNTPFVPPRPFDLVVCLGVVEHLPVFSAETLVATLTDLGSVVLFSPATAGPGGIDSSASVPWDGLFAARGFRPHRGFGQRLAHDRDVDRLYSRDLVFYARPGAAQGVDLDLRYLDGPPRAVSLDRLQPVVMTCARDIPLTRRFVDSYAQRVGAALPAPMVSVDLTAGPTLPDEYVALLDRLEPAAVMVHPRVEGVTDFESVNDAAYAAVASGLEALGDRDCLLFIEDDILFSSRFIPFLSGLRLEPDTGLYTLYQPFSGYGSAVIETRRFFGTQCLLIPGRAASEILVDRGKSEQWPTFTYDLRWTRSLALCGYKLYGALASYVQHVGDASRYGSGSHRSETFVE